MRRQAVGRKNWLFVGSDQAADVNTAFVSLLASCQQHAIEPSGYLRDLFCLLPRWPLRRILELSPARWRETLEQADAQERLDANLYRQVALGKIGWHLAQRYLGQPPASRRVPPNGYITRM